MKLFCFKQKIPVFLLVLTVISGQLFGAKKKSKTENSKQATATYSNSGSSVKLPSAKRTYFYKIDESIVKNVETGSPESLKAAMQAIHRIEGDYEENEKVLIAIAAGIMKQVWPSQTITWSVPEFKEDNIYLGAIESARQGIFDSSTGNTDFLSTVLSALVAVTPGCDESNYPLCVQACTAALQLNSSSVLANYLLGISLEKQKNNQQAAAALRNAYNMGSPSIELAIAYARVLLACGQSSEAKNVLSKMEGESSNLEVLRLNAFIAFAQNNLADAEQYVARVLQQAPNDLEFVLFRAKILIEKKDYIHGVSLLDMYARQNDSSLDYLILRTKVQLEWSRNTTVAAQTVEKALQLYPDNMDALMLAAEISSETDLPVAGKYADELAAKILEKDGNNKTALGYALTGLMQRENWKSAYSIAAKLIGESDVSPEVIENYVKVCIKLGKKAEAFEFAKKMQMKYQDDETVLQSYVLAYAENGNRDTVVKYIDSLIPYASAKLKSYLYYRRSYLQFTDDNVLADLRSSLIANPRNSDALFRLYEVYYSKSDYRKAQYYLRQVVAINPNDSSVRKLNEALTQLIK